MRPQVDCPTLPGGARRPLGKGGGEKMEGGEVGAWLHEPVRPPRDLPPRPLLAFRPRKDCLAEPHSGRGARGAGGALLLAWALGPDPRRGGALGLVPTKASTTLLRALRDSPRLSSRAREEELKTRPGSTGSEMSRSLAVTGREVARNHRCRLALIVVLKDSPKSRTT